MSGLAQSSYDPSLYYKLEDGFLVGAVAAHVDDLAVVGLPGFVRSFITGISGKFKSHYIESVRNRFLSSDDSKTTPSPTATSFKLLRKRLPDSTKAPPEYNQLIGSLLWISQFSRPDIAFAVNKLSQFLQDPSVEH